MNQKSSNVNVAVVQAAPVLFDKDASIEKACGLLREAAEQGAEFILFPEAFIPAYPRGFSFGMVVGSRDEEGRRLWQRYWENSVELPGPATEKLGKVIKETGVYVALGVIERDMQASGGTLYCTLVYFNPDGKIIGKHRKIKPTASERLIWGEGDGSTLTVLNTELGKIGGLICWENYMPLARMTMYQKGVEFYLAPTADQRDGWQASMRHIAMEGRCFVLSCNQYITKDMYPSDLPGIEELKDQPDIMCRGGSVIVSPMGDVIAGPMFNEEGILYASLDHSELVRAKVDMDVTGHYARPDIFQLNVNAKELKSVSES